MRFKLAAVLFLFLFAAGGGINAAGLKKSIPEIARCRQLIVVTTAGWETSVARVNCYEREAGGPWRMVERTFPAVVGRNGMAWGIGLHGAAPADAPVKREGDSRAPAGVFRLNEIFGFATPAASGITRFPYVQLTATSEGIDDSRSRYYNRVIDASRIKDRDWATSETMKTPSGAYRWGVFVEHNWDRQPGAGSCIFIHRWQGQERGTSGCTGMPPSSLLGLIRWLDASKQPLLVQLPAREYERLKARWGLP
ncbi:MAG TPA: L,D-transpeptidase family protein [Chthoniobacteraceae bacterium]|nr:L,D-transpeptidase family protein [Chthoniobacteraceae bacterium]